MNKQKAKNQTLIINYKSPRPINIGDVFYFVKPIFSESQDAFNDEAPGLCALIGTSLNYFVVHRYEINKIEYSKPFSKNPTPEIFITLMHYTECKGKRSYDDCHTFTLKTFFKEINVIHEESREAKFDDYNLALLEAERRNQLIKDNLAGFNAKYGTDFTFNLNAIKHDPK